MTVGELVLKLDAFDRNLRVVTPGFDESNLDDVEEVKLVRVTFHDEKRISHCGRHVKDEHGELAVLINFG